MCFKKPCRAVALKTIKTQIDQYITNVLLKPSCWHSSLFPFFLCQNKTLCYQKTTNILGKDGGKIKYRENDTKKAGKIEMQQQNKFEIKYTYI